MVVFYKLFMMNATEIIATYTTKELEELLQFVETKEGRFEDLKRQLKYELAGRSQPAERSLADFDYTNCTECPF
jgi:hypothetical protein